jgi:geranylgeranyl pyrophosphate synthase
VLLLGGGGSERAAAQQLGERIGLAFQIRDDLLDFIGTKGRGQGGADIREGKPSWPVLQALETGPADERQRLLAVLNKAANGESPNDEVVDRWLQWVSAHGGGEKAGRALADTLADARDLVPAAFPHDGRETILALCDRLESLDG